MTVDKHVEMSISKRLTFAERAKYMLLSVLPMLAGAYLLVLIISLKLSSLIALGALAFAATVFASYKLYCMSIIDWEYVFVEDEIRFSKIINKTRRRELLTVDLTKSELLARADSGECASFLHNPEYKVYRFTGGTENEAWLVAGVSSKGQRAAVVFEPDERMLEALKYVMRSKFHG